MGSTNPTLIVSSPDEDNPRTYDAYDAAIDDYYGAPDSVNDNSSIYHAPRYSKSRSNRPHLPRLDTSERNFNHMHKNSNEEQISFDQHRPATRTKGSPTMSPSSPTATAAATAVMAQEMSAVQALKRLSIGALPTLDPDLPNYNESSSNPSSPIRGSPASSPRSDSAGFEFTSPKSPNSLQVPKEGQRHQPGINASQASQLLWVPAHVHPEIAPQQWKSFVQDKLAEIRATQSSDSLSRSSSTSSTSSSNAIKRRNSRLSRQIEDQEGYTDGADVLEKRRSSDNLLQKATDPTIQSLSHQLESLGELEGWSVDPFELVRSLSMQKSSNPYSLSSTSPISEYPTAPLANDSDTPILPSPTSSLRRSTKTRINKSSIRRGRRDIAASRTHNSEPTGLSQITSPVDKKLSSNPSIESVPEIPSTPSTPIPSIPPSTSTTHSSLTPKKSSPSTPTDPERLMPTPPTPSAPPLPQRQQRPRTRHSPERKPVQRVRIPITNKPLSECPELPPSRKPSGRSRPPEPAEPVKSSALPQQQDVPKVVESPRQMEGPRRREPASSSQMAGIVGNDYDNVPKLITQPAQQQQSKPKRPTMKRQTGSLSSTSNIVQRTENQLEMQAGAEVADKSGLRPSHSLNTGRRGPKSPTSYGETQQMQSMQPIPPIEHSSKDQMHIDAPAEIKPEIKVEATPVNQQAVAMRPSDRRASAENRPSDVDEEASVPSQPHSRAKTRKGTWGWLFNGAAGGSYSGSGKSSPVLQEKQSSRPGVPAVTGPVAPAMPSSPPFPGTPEPASTPFSSEVVDKATVDKFLNRAPVSEPKNEPLYTTTLQTAQSPELVVTTIDDGEVSSQKVPHSTASSSISETKDRISHFFSKKKSIANLKAQKYGDPSSDNRAEDQEGLRPDSYANSRSPSPSGDFKSPTKSPKVISKPRNRSKNRDKTRARYRSRSRHQSPERAEPVRTQQQQHEQQKQHQHQQKQQQQQQEQQQVPIQNLPNGIPGPTTNAAGFVTYSAEAAAYYGAPYQIPAHQYSDKSMYMMNHRYAPHIERAIYRLSHLKLGNPRRPLVQQVLLSNFMYAYLNLINQGFIRQQQEAQMQLQLQQQAQQRQITAGGQRQHEQQVQSQYMYQGGYDTQQQYGEHQQQEHQQQEDYGAYNQDYEREYENQYERFANSEPEGADHAEFSYENSYKMRGTADSSSSSSSSSVAGDDMWSGDAQPKGYDDEEMFYDSHEQVS